MIQRQRTGFEPFPPNLDLHHEVDSTANFTFVERIHCQAINQNPREEFEQLVLYHVVLLGIPLVIEGFHDHLNKRLFSEQWLRQKYSSKKENARDLVKGINLPLTMGHYLKNLSMLSRQFNQYNYADKDRQRIYLKDIDCPTEWHDALEQLIPPALFYLNGFPKPFKGPGSQFSNVLDCPVTADAVPIAKAGDLMSCLPEGMRADNLMCYIGHEGTYTPAHQEMCASLGHNIMVEASDGSFENGKPTTPGSSLWLMTETKDRHIVSEYWRSALGHDIDLEDHFASFEAWKNAPFRTWVVNQKPGDLVLIPPLAAHQVWNRGTRTMKVAWNRTTVDTLQMALAEAIPHARMVCRDEQYKNKAIIFFSLERYSILLQQAGKTDHPEVEQLRGDFEKLFWLYTDILLSESFPKDRSKEDVEYIGFDSNVTCSYCRCNIFNRFLTCPWCVGGENDTYDICMDCYVLGRSCQCVSRLKWVEQFQWSELREKHSKWRLQLISLDKTDGKSKERYPTFNVAQAGIVRKSTATICQEQLALRPWVDYKKPMPKEANATPSDGDSDEENSARKRRKLNGNNKTKDIGSCHMCRNTELSWKMAKCTKCHLQYCYAVLFRAFDILPHVPMETRRWLCPRCKKNCNCDSCRQEPTMNPYEPYNILLGYDTRKFADPRSIESLVNLRLSNVKLLQKFGDDNARRLEQRQRDADKARLGMPEANHAVASSALHVSSASDSLVISGSQLHIPVDPALELDHSIASNDHR
ncbi:uncharacterized protein N7459_009812 [Penicillium hispanicum]|uniref:uncharacterized protein n=1 Tax=Penicillium hispanicum TaxID=1080232 RepID=UPI00254061EF|nr:uncharacterized protein N7459_009812 [Penicillium hispanicum]KAJ5570382.1 hypothetical protein N7459_009812 [Penicillium hispanicum]